MTVFWYIRKLHIDNVFTTIRNSEKRMEPILLVILHQNLLIWAYSEEPKITISR